MKIIFMGTPDFAVPTLESLYEAGYKIDLVITQKDRRRGRGKKLKYTPVKEKAIELGLEVYQPENVNSKESIQKIKELSPDFIVVAAYGQIIKKEIISVPRYNIINVHASLLPKYRGAAPINWAIINGETKTGVTIMEIEEGLDTGDMILKEEVEIKDLDDSETIYDKLSYIGGKIITKAIEGLVENSIEKEKQDDSISSYAPMLNKDMGLIDWSKDGKDIVNLIRGLKPWPTAYTRYKEENMKLHSAIYLDKDIEGKKSGEIIKVNKEGIFVKTGKGIVVLKEIQFPGNKKMLVSDYIKGNTIEQGIILL